MMDVIAARVETNMPEMLRFLERLVNTESPTEDPVLANQAGDLLAGKAASLGFACSRDAQPGFADTRICRLGAGGAGKRVLLIGHFDTVYPRGTVADRPFRIAGERATGCGVLDMKGGLAAALFAIQAVQEAGARLPPLTFVFNGDEEVGSPASRACILEEAGRHDLALVFEPGKEGSAVVTGRKGVGIWRLDVAGREAHAGAEPEKGANAIVAMARHVLAIQDLADPACGTTVNPGVIQGGSKPYVVPGACALEIDIRVPSAAEQARIEAGLRRIAAETGVPGTVASLSGGFHRPPMESSAAAENHLAQLQVIAAHAGFPLGAVTSGGASDGNLTAAAGLPTLDGLGPHGARAHSPDEFIELPTLSLKCRILAEFLAALAPSVRS